MTEAQKTLDWGAIAEAARALGVSKKALEKWRQRRSVPHKWRLPIIRHTAGRVSAESFERGDAA